MCNVPSSSAHITLYLPVWCEQSLGVVVRHDEGLLVRQVGELVKHDPARSDQSEVTSHQPITAHLLVVDFWVARCGPVTSTTRATSQAAREGICTAVCLLYCTVPCCTVLYYKKLENLQTDRQRTSRQRTNREFKN